MQKFRVAAIQTDSRKNKDQNLKKAEKLIIQAVRQKARFIVLPEVFNYRGNIKDVALAAETIPGLSTNLISHLAKKHKVWILIGSLMEKSGKQGYKTSSSKPYNTSILINPSGKIIAKYRKIHLFDIKLGDKIILESHRNQPGKKPKIVSIDNLKVGLSICYDLRFPELFRYYSKKYAEIICIPSSFTQKTGEAHWHTLVRARAIENLCYIIAPNQAGIGSDGVKTYGHSLIVDPWGKILAEGPSNKESIIIADLDFDYLRMLRKNLPFLKHRKL